MEHAVSSRFIEGSERHKTVRKIVPQVHSALVHIDHEQISLVAEINARGLRKTTKETGLDRKTIRRLLNKQKVKVSTLAKVVSELREE